MTFIEAVATVFRKYAVFRGVAARSEYWYFFLFTFLLGLVLGTIDGVVSPTANPEIIAEEDLLSLSDMNLFSLSNLANLALLLPTLAVTARRFRDAGFSPKLLWFYLLPFALLLFPMVSVLTAAGNDLPVSPSDQLAIFLLFAPAFVSIFALSIATLVIALQRTKTAEQGNKYVLANEQRED